MKRYWLLKSEPSTFSIEDLARMPHQTTCWEGVRNYRARNFLRAMRCGDEALFYHSNANPPAVVGIVGIVREAYPDHFAHDPTSRYYDARSAPDRPRWWMVDVRLVRTFPVPVSLDQLRRERALEGMELLRRGSRLSVQPVRKREWDAIMRLVDRAGRHRGTP